VFQQARAVRPQPVLPEAGESEGFVPNSGGRVQREQMITNLRMLRLIWNWERSRTE